MSSPMGDRAEFRTRLASRITELRLAIDLGDTRSDGAFKAALERDGLFVADDPRVIDACRLAGLSARLLGPSDQ